MIIVISINTTHEDPDSAHVIEIGAITDTAKTFHSLCNPGINLSSYHERLKTLGISEEEILSAPPVDEAAGEFFDFIEGHLLEYEVWLAGFNSGDHTAPILWKDPFGIPMDRWKYDILEMAMDPMKEAGALPSDPPEGSPAIPTLSDVERFFKVKRKGPPHGAISDARVTMEILKILLGVQ
ncbi:MAG: hypothetical protein ACMUIG_02315 [Thermoplasmatota archaeon]